MSPLNINPPYKFKVSALLLASACLAAGFTPSVSHAFCGFYVSGATGELFNDATQVVLMRDGMRTVLSMQNAYQGPLSDFAMVVPVPVVLQKEDVKTLPHGAMSKIDQMGAPRLVEYWEQDPCAPEQPMLLGGFGLGVSGIGRGGGGASDTGGLGVKVEAQFKVGEYEIVILSAKDSTGLDTWLKQNKYNIPAGAEPLLRPYVESGSKFFVAKIDAEKVKFNGNKAMLSPLRFHYDTQEFSLPIRLGLINANGPQDLIVHILAKNQRYEVANYKNAFIPTNLKVDGAVKDRFAEFYAALFDETLKKNPNAVITEYSWSANTCDPCPGATIDKSDIVTFGGDVIPRAEPWEMVLTRLHARYTKDTVGEDLVFKAAPAVMGGRGTPDAQGVFGEKGAVASPSQNNFQGRYAVLHPWEGKVECQSPIRGRWGGPPQGAGELGGGGGQTRVAQGLAQAPRGGFPLGEALRQDVPELGFTFQGSAKPSVGEADAGVARDAAPQDKPDAAPQADVGQQAAPDAAPQDKPDASAPAQPASSGGCAVATRGGGGLSWLALALGVSLALRKRARR
jgi:hypothetical protein